jgi:hypothetical protein
MTSSFSLIFQNVEESTPRGVHDTFRQMRVLHHVVNIQFLNGNHLVLFSIGLCGFEMKITTLTFDFQMGLGCASGSLPLSFAALLATCCHALLASEGAGRLARVAGIVCGVAVAISQKGLETYINADRRMGTCRGSMLSLGKGFTNDESVPMSISSQDKVTGLGYSFYRAMKFDFERTAQLLWNRQVLSISRKREIGLMLTQWDRMPAIGLLETRKPALLPQFFSRKEASEGLIQSISQHLDRGSWYMLTATTLEPCGEIIFSEELARLLIMLLRSRQHLIVDVPRLSQAA